MGEGVQEPVRKRPASLERHDMLSNMRLISNCG